MALPASAKTITFMVTRDRAASVAFYSSVLGFTFISEDDFAAVLDLNGIMLRISVVENHQPQPYTVLGWAVTDITGSVQTLRNNGVAFKIYPGSGQNNLGIWPAPDGTKIAWLLDPDGNILSLTQF